MSFFFRLYPLGISSILMFLCIGACQPLLPILETKQSLRTSSSWTEVESYPQKIGRTDDLSFVNPQLGWAINSQGVLFKTADGGQTWDLQFKKEDSFFRCLVFKDSLNGWLGTLGRDDPYLHSTDSITLYETHDGGQTWSPTVINGPYPEGLCGMQKINDQVMVACGRVRGPSYFIKTVDGGQTWVSKNLDHIAGSMIAPYFFDENHGIIVGGTTRDKEHCRSLMVSTQDGGETWDTLYLSKQTGEYLWKISFPSRQIGYVSVQRNNREGICYFLKTEDGGKTWQEKEYADGHYYAQGIGFLNEQVGWIGGSFQYSYETRDGGETWVPIETGKGLNNFQFVNNTTAYMVGRGVYKFNGLEPLPDGWQMTYFPNGKTQTQKKYQKGILEGKAIIYHPNGRIREEGKYVHNLKKGKWKYYNEQGHLTKKIKYKNDVAQLSTTILQSFEGAYRINDRAYRNIFFQNGQLYSKRSDRNSVFKIYPESDNTFFYENNRDLKVTFVFDGESTVQHMLMYRPGREWKALKATDQKALEQFEKERGQINFNKD